MKKIFTLAIVVDNQRVLLGRKVRKLGAGKWNGFGGGVEEGESVAEAARRECVEEVGIVPLDMEEAGRLVMHYPDKPLGADVHEIHVFRVFDWSGVLKETDEMVEPRWFAVDKVPYDEMWVDDQYWLPEVLAGKWVSGEFWFTMGGALERHEVCLDDPVNVL